MAQELPVAAVLFERCDMQDNPIGVVSVPLT
jgi:hypothetical protein